MSSLLIEKQNLGGFNYRNWIIFDDAGTIVALDQDIKFCSRVLGLDAMTFTHDYMERATADTTAEMQELILAGVEKRLNEMGISVNDLSLYPEEDNE